MPKEKRNLPLYIGGFMGPFGATLVLPMFPRIKNNIHNINRSDWMGLHRVSFAVCNSPTDFRNAGRKVGKKEDSKMHLSSICNCFIIVCSSPKLRIVPNRKKPPRYCKCIHYTLTFVRTGRTKPRKKIWKQSRNLFKFPSLGDGHGSNHRRYLC